VDSGPYDFSVILRPSVGFGVSDKLFTTAVFSLSILTFSVPIQKSNSYALSVHLNPSDPIPFSVVLVDSRRFSFSQFWSASRPIRPSVAIEPSVLDESEELKATVGFKGTAVFTASPRFEPSLAFPASSGLRVTSTFGATTDAVSEGSEGGNQPKSSPLGLIIGIAAGVLFLLIVSGVVAIYIRRRQLAKEGEEGEESIAAPTEVDTQTYNEQEELTLDYHNPLSDGHVSGGDDDAFSDNLDEDV
jgi:hypothetical protein